jgi:phage gp37-like protein
MQPATLQDILAGDPIAETQAAIVAKLSALLKGVAIVAHPGKADVSELVGKTIVRSPGVGVGWSRIRSIALADGSYSATVEWVAYIVAEATIVGGKRVEMERVGYAIGGQILKILSDVLVSTWGRTGVTPVETSSPAPELKPLFTVKDQEKGTVYYTVSWTQQIADIGTSIFPAPIGTANPDEGSIEYAENALIAAMAPWLPAEVIDDA